jgi:hypothetical protein
MDERVMNSLTTWSHICFTTRSTYSLLCDYDNIFVVNSDKITQMKTKMYGAKELVINE